jgi:hypothetical protein
MKGEMGFFYYLEFPNSPESWDDNHYDDHAVLSGMYWGVMKALHERK